MIKKNIVTPVNQLKREWDIKDLRAKVLSLRMVAIQVHELQRSTCPALGLIPSSQEPDAKFVQILCRFTSQQTFKLTDTKVSTIAVPAAL